MRAFERQFTWTLAAEEGIQLWRVITAGLGFEVIRHARKRGSSQISSCLLATRLLSVGHNNISLLGDFTAANLQFFIRMPGPPTLILSGSVDFFCCGLWSRRRPSSSTFFIPARVEPLPPSTSFVLAVVAVVVAVGRRQVRPKACAADVPFDVM